MRKTDISVIIVFYKKKKKLYNCLKSIYDSRPKVAVEIVVVDNSNKKIHKELWNKFPKVRYIKTPENLGYSGGNNLGAGIAQGKYLFILNPDTEAFETTLDVLFNFLNKNTNVAIVAPSLVDKNGRRYTQIRHSALTPGKGIVRLSFLNKLFPPREDEFSKDGEVDVVAGSAFMIRKNVFDEIGGFDENLFLFFEEQDLGKRISEAGYKIFVTPKAKIRHFWKKESADGKSKHFANSRFYYFRKHFGLFNALLVELFARVGIRSLFIK